MFLYNFSIAYCKLLNNGITFVFLPNRCLGGCGIDYFMGEKGSYIHRKKVGTLLHHLGWICSLKAFLFVPGFVPFSRRMFLFHSKCSFLLPWIACKQVIFIDSDTLMSHEHVVDFSSMSVIFGHLFLFRSKCPSNVPANSREKGTAESLCIRASRNVCSFVPPFFM